MGCVVVLGIAGDRGTRKPLCTEFEVASTESCREEPVFSSDKEKQILYPINEVELAHEVGKLLDEPSLH